jgi:hypothetical protein
MFDIAIKSGIPVIGVQTDDLPNFEAVLQKVTKATPRELPKTFPAHFSNKYIYFTNSLDLVSVDLYSRLMGDNAQLVVINPEKKSDLVFDAGIMPTPPEMVRDYLKHVLPEEQIDDTMKALKGMSLKTIGEIVMMTQARTGGTAISEVRRTRAMFGGSVQGLYPVDTEIDFYQMPPQIEEWLTLNRPYFLGENIPPKLRPRGILMAGPPGVGKSMGAKAIANYFDVPLYRLDIATTMNRYIGESEARVARSLALIEKESPCVLLLDEVEKIFSDKDDAGVTSRILSQLLWWLADHQSQIITVMTTNNKSIIPPELYREGRVDFTLEIMRLSLEEAIQFGAKVFLSMLGKGPDTGQYVKIRNILEMSGDTEFSHALVAELVYKLIKMNGWYELGANV